MAIDFLSSPVIQLFTNNGALAAGWYVYVYTANTTTLSTIYATIADARAGTNAIANPVVADSRGEVVIVPSESSKIAIYDGDKDNGGNLIRTVDYVHATSGDIADSNGNDVLTFTATPAAVNHFNMTNAAVGGKPVQTVTGTDTNIAVRYTSKGAGAFEVESGSDGIKLNTTNNGAVTTGTGAFTAGGNATVTGNLAVTGTSNFTGAVTATGTFNSMTGAASQSDQETSTSAVKSVTPSVQQFHPSAAKCWLKANGSTAAVEASYNITSTTDTGTGDIAITIATDFSSANWTALCAALTKPSYVSAIAAGTCSIQSFISTTGNLSDPTSYFFAGFGDQ